MRRLRLAVLHILSDGRVQAEILPQKEGCHSADGCAGCTACASGASAPGGGLLVDLPGVSGRREGEVVEVWLEAPGQTVLALTLMGLPLALALGGGLLGNALLGESWLAVSGAIGLALGFGAVYFLNKSILRVRAELA